MGYSNYFFVFLVRPTQSSDTSLEKQAQNLHSSIKRINKLVRRTEKDNVEALSLVVTQLFKSRSVAFIIYVKKLLSLALCHVRGFGSRLALDFHGRCGFRTCEEEDLFGLSWSSTFGTCEERGPQRQEREYLLWY